MNTVDIREYIKFGTGAYIPLDFTNTANTKVQVVLKNNSITNTYVTIFGQRDNGNRYQSLYGYFSPDGKLELRWGNGDFKGAAYRNDLRPIELSSQAIVVDGVTVKTNNSFSGTAYPMYIGAVPVNGQMNAECTGAKDFNIYYFRVYENNVLVRDCYPAVDADGDVCMYDAVREIYMYSTGTSNLSVSDIQGNDYLSEYASNNIEIGGAKDE